MRTQRNYLDIFLGFALMNFHPHPRTNNKNSIIVKFLFNTLTTSSDLMEIEKWIRRNSLFATTICTVYAFSNSLTFYKIFVGDNIKA